MNGKSEIEVVEGVSQMAIERPFVSGAFSFPKALSASYSEITDAYKAAGLTQSGSPYAKFHDLNWEGVRNKSMFMLMISMMFSKHRATAGILVEGNSEAGDVVDCFEAPKHLKISHFGPVTNTMSTYKKATTWAHENQVELQNYSIESYVGIYRGEDMKVAETIIYIPIA